MNRRLMSFAFLFIAPKLAIAGLFGGPSNYDECVVDRMKGQEKFMYGAVRRSCEREFEVKLDDISSVKLNWTNTTSDGIEVSIGRNDSAYELTKALLMFSKKSCDESKDADFNIRAEAVFRSWMPGKSPNEKAMTKMESPHSVQCFRTLEVYGKRVK